IYNYGIIFGGDDTVAVDAIGGKLLGLKNLEVGTTFIAHKRGLGIGDVNQIKVDFDDNVNSLIQNVPYDFRSNYFPEKCLPPNYKRLIGENKFGKNVLEHCRCGCIGLTQVSLELIWQDSSELAKNDTLTIIHGKNFVDKELRNLKEPILLMGTCACELYEKLKKNYVDVRMVNSCGNLNDFYSMVLNVLGIDALSTIGFNQEEIIYNLLLAQLNDVNAYIPLTLELKDVISVLNSRLKFLPDALFQDEEFDKAIEKMVFHEKVGVRAETQKLLGSLIKDKKMEKYSRYMEVGLSDKKNKIIKLTLKTAEKLLKTNKNVIKFLKPKVEELLKHQNKDIRKFSEKIIQEL
ncbi:MAG: hypothetical protein ACTSVE_11855, partial [Candidatus Helarchaeota archaeon]